MPGRGRLALVGVVLGVVAVAAAGCASDSGGSSGGGGNASATTAVGAGGGNEIKLTAQNTSWDTTSLQFTSGAKVTVQVANKDGVKHNFTFKEASVAQDVEGGEDATVSSQPRPPAATSSSASITRRR